MANKNQIEIRCKKCGKLDMEVEIEGRLKYDFTCKRCRNRNIGVITRKFNSQKPNGCE